MNNASEQNSSDLITSVADRLKYISLCKLEQNALEKSETCNESVRHLKIELAKGYKGKALEILSKYVN